MNDPYKKIVVDVDGTLCSNTDGGDYTAAKPVKHVIDAVNRYYERGYHVTVFTARGMHRFSGDVARCERELGELTRRWLDESGIKYHVLMFGKPSSDLYIDDKAILPDDFATRDPR